MRKTLTYSGFIVASLVLVLVFATSKSYTQLGVAVLLYPLLVFFAYKLFINRTWSVPAEKVKAVLPEHHGERVGILDTDKRDFLKMIGAAGLSFLLFSLFNRRTDILFPSKSITAPEAERSPLEGYQITEIDDSATTYYGFTNKQGAWIIMKVDTETSSFRYTRGDSKFSDNWEGRTALNYVYFHELF